MLKSVSAAICGIIVFSTGAHAQSATNDPATPLAHRQTHACPVTTQPDHGVDGVSCVGGPGFIYTNLRSLSDVPASYKGRVYVLNPRDSGYQRLNW